MLITSINMSSKLVYVPRKRKIKKYIAADQQAPSAGSLTNYTLYTAVEDGETLSRIVGNLSAQAPITGASGSGHFYFVVYVSRDLASPTSLITTVSGREAEAILYTGSVKVQRVQNVWATDYNFMIDTKGQRKLRAGDVVKLAVHPISIDPEICWQLNHFIKMP